MRITFDLVQVEDYLVILGKMAEKRQYFFCRKLRMHRRIFRFSSKHLVIHKLIVRLPSRVLTVVVHGGIDKNSSVPGHERPRPVKIRYIRKYLHKAVIN